MKLISLMHRIVAPLAALLALGACGATLVTSDPHNRPLWVFNGDLQRCNLIARSAVGNFHSFMKVRGRCMQQLGYRVIGIDSPEPFVPAPAPPPVVIVAPPVVTAPPQAEFAPPEAPSSPRHIENVPEPAPP